MNNHLQMSLKYHEHSEGNYRVVGFEVEPRSIKWDSLKYDGQQCSPKSGDWQQLPPQEIVKGILETVHKVPHVSRRANGFCNTYVAVCSLTDHARPIYVPATRVREICVRAQKRVGLCARFLNRVQAQKVADVKPSLCLGGRIPINTLPAVG